MYVWERESLRQKSWIKQRKQPIKRVFTIKKKNPELNHVNLLKKTSKLSEIGVDSKYMKW